MDFKKKSTTSISKSPANKKFYHPLRFNQNDTDKFDLSSYVKNHSKQSTKVNASFKPVVINKPKNSLSPEPAISSSESDYDEQKAKDLITSITKKNNLNDIFGPSKKQVDTTKTFRIPKKKKAVNDENQPMLEKCIEKKKEADLKTMIDDNSEHVKRMMMLTKGLKIEKPIEPADEVVKSKVMKLTPEKQDSFNSSSDSFKINESPCKSQVDNFFLPNEDHWIPNDNDNWLPNNTDFNPETFDSMSHLENVKRIANIIKPNKDDKTLKKASPLKEVTRNNISPITKPTLKKASSVIEVEADKPASPKIASIFNIKKKGDQEKKNRKFDYIAISTNDKLENEIDKIKKIGELNANQIEYMILKDINYFLDIFSGNVEHCWRHTEYKKYSKKSGDLLYSHAAGMGSYTQGQIFAAVTALQSIFCRKNNSLDEYIVKVVLPEALIKICMRIYQCSKDSAEEYLQEINLKKENDTFPSESYTKL